MIFDPFETCPRCGGDGYQPVPFTRDRLFVFPCTGCDGSGLRERAAHKVIRLLRHGAKTVSEGDY